MIYTYGYILNRDGSYRHPARLREDGKVEFSLWRADEEGNCPFWHLMGSGWEKQFVEGSYDIREEYLV